LALGWITVVCRWDRDRSFMGLDIIVAKYVIDLDDIITRRV